MGDMRQSITGYELESFVTQSLIGYAYKHIVDKIAFKIVIGTFQDMPRSNMT